MLPLQSWSWPIWRGWENKMFVVVTLIQEAGIWRLWHQFRGCDFQYFCFQLRGDKPLEMIWFFFSSVMKVFLCNISHSFHCQVIKTFTFIFGIFFLCLFICRLHSRGSCPLCGPSDSSQELYITLYVAEWDSFESFLCWSCRELVWFDERAWSCWNQPSLANEWRKFSVLPLEW